MTTLYENQLQNVQGPMLSFFCLLDSQNKGFVSYEDLKAFLSDQSDTITASFVQKKILFMLLSKVFTRLDRSKVGKLYPHDFFFYGPKLLKFLCGAHITEPQTCISKAQEVFALFTQNSKELSLSKLAEHCIYLLPSLTPNRKLVSLCMAKSIHTFCTHPYSDKSQQISEKQWCDSALSLHFELLSQK